MNNPKPIILVIIFLFLNFVSSFAQTPTNYNGVIGKEVSITGNTEQLQYFFNALQSYIDLLNLKIQ